MQTITRKEIWRIGMIYLRWLLGKRSDADLRWICETRPRAAWFEEMLHGRSYGGTYMVIE